MTEGFFAVLGLRRVLGVLSLSSIGRAPRTLSLHSHSTSLPLLFFHPVFLDKSNNQHWPGALFFHNTLFGAESYTATSWLSPTDNFSGRNPDQFDDWYKKSCLTLSIARPGVLHILEGQAKPSATSSGATESLEQRQAAYDRTNQDQFAILYLISLPRNWRFFW